ncbi:MAG TPA: GNAT family N-acetyltransferase [Acidimicrobiia bacterium]|nr:GNAT family N-acetyltransferase [Acidimicrobiia bacterium]
MESARRATRDDVPRVAELARAMRAELRSMRGGAVWSEREAWAEPLDDVFVSLLARDDARLFVGTIGDVVVGYGAVVVETLHDGARLGVVTDLFVEEGARAVGVGESLMGCVLAFTTEQGCVGVDALALPGHRAAKNFFEGSGFTARAIVMHRPAG